MSYESFCAEVRRRSGLDDAEVDRVIKVTLAMLGSRLRQVDARAVAERLPPELASCLIGEAETAAHDAELASEERMRAVCRVLAETLDEQGRAQLRMQPLTSLFVH